MNKIEGAKYRELGDCSFGACCYIGGNFHTTLLLVTFRNALCAGWKKNVRFTNVKKYARVSNLLL